MAPRFSLSTANGRPHRLVAIYSALSAIWHFLFGPDYRRGSRYGLATSTPPRYWAQNS
jgi:hypothetical protein